MQGDGTRTAKPFDYEEALARIARSRHNEELPGEERREKVRASLQVEYKTPLNLAFTPDGRELYVACEASHTVIVVDVATRQKVIAEIAVGGHTDRRDLQPRRPPGPTSAIAWTTPCR